MTQSEPATAAPLAPSTEQKRIGLFAALGERTYLIERLCAEVDVIKKNLNDLGALPKLEPAVPEVKLPEPEKVEPAQAG